MKKFFIALIIATTFLSSPLKAQVVRSVEDDVSQFFRTGGDLFNSFTKFDQSTQIKFGASLAAIAAGYSLDYNLKDFATHARSKAEDDLFSIDRVFGSEYTLIGIGGLYGYGVIFRNQEIRKVGLQTIEAVGYAGLITSILKAVVGRSRPYANEGKSMFRPFNVHVATTSFPSGHSTVAFAVSTVLANNTNSIFLKIFYYTASTAVAFARIYHNAHWFSDVITGGLIGHFVGDFVSTNNINSKNSHKKFSFYVLPNGIGVSVAF